MMDDHLDQWADATGAAMWQSGAAAAEPSVAADAQLRKFVLGAVGRRVPGLVARPDWDRDVVVLTNESRTAVEIRIGEQRLHSKWDGTTSDLDAIVEAFVAGLAED